MVVEHQTISAEQILSYCTDVNDDRIPQMLKSIKENMSVLGFRVCGNIIVAKHSSFTEFLIPVDREFESTDDYKFKKIVRLVNAARLRHYGSFCNIQKSLIELNSYISKNKLCSVTSPYIVELTDSDGAYDIYIGISENLV